MASSSSISHNAIVSRWKMMTSTSYHCRGESEENDSRLGVGWGYLPSHGVETLKNKKSNGGFSFNLERNFFAV